MNKRWVDKNNNVLRKIARSAYWQTLYARSKDLNNIRLFANDYELTKLQMSFLNWLETYSSLFIDLYLGEEYISEQIIENDLLCDAYLSYKSKKQKNEQRGMQKKPKDSKPKSERYNKDSITETESFAINFK